MYIFNVFFDFDLAKSQKNLQKHGISFEEARQLWVVFGVEGPAQSHGEERWVRIGLLGSKFTLAFIRCGKGLYGLFRPEEAVRVKLKFII